MRFYDREDAGRQLAARLTKHAGRPDVLVLALPRGGVPVAYEVARYGFVDTESVYWNIVPQQPIQYGRDGEPTAETVALEGNLYGGIPSHHLSWALWCALALWPVVRRRRRRWLLLLYPLLTFGAVVATANHRFIDLAGSIAEVAIAYGLASLLERALTRRRERRARDATPGRGDQPRAPEHEALPGVDQRALVR